MDAPQSKSFMKNCLCKLIVALLALMAIQTSLASEIRQVEPITASLVKEKNIVDLLIKKVELIAPPDSDVELKQIIELRHSKNKVRYIVPVRTHNSERNGCHIYNFDQKMESSQTVLVSQDNEVESCEIVAAAFSCNRDEKSTSGLGVLYGKRLGADHYWFEGSYFSIDINGTLNERKELSERLTDIEKVSVARKELTCR